MWDQWWVSVSIKFLNDPEILYPFPGPHNGVMCSMGAILSLAETCATEFALRGSNATCFDPRLLAVVMILGKPLKLSNRRWSPYDEGISTCNNWLQTGTSMPEFLRYPLKFWFCCWFCCFHRFVSIWPAKSLREWSFDDAKYLSMLAFLPLTAFSWVFWFHFLYFVSMLKLQSKLSRASDGLCCRDICLVC